MPHEQSALDRFDPMEASAAKESAIRNRTAGVMLSVAAALALGACAESPASLPTHSATSTTVPSAERTPSTTATTSPETAAPTTTQPSATKEAVKPTGPELPNPAAFKNGQFLGAIVIDYKNNASRPWGDISAYYTRNGRQRPALNDPFVHRMVAGTVDSKGMDVISDAALANGAVLDKTSTNKTIVIGMHDITPVTAPVRLDGHTYAQSQMGINAVVVPGDRLTWVMPAGKGKVQEFTFEARRSYVINATNQKQINALFETADPHGKTILRTYKCWKPGDDKQRLIDEFVLVETHEEAGTVAAVGGTGKALPSR